MSFQDIRIAPVITKAIFFIISQTKFETFLKSFMGLGTVGASDTFRMQNTWEMLKLTSEPLRTITLMK